MQRCWVYKTVHVLNKKPKIFQASVKGHLHEIFMAENRGEVEKFFDLFVKLYSVKCDKATCCLSKDCERLLSFH